MRCFCRLRAPSVGSVAGDKQQIVLALGLRQAPVWPVNIALTCAPAGRRPATPPLAAAILLLAKHAQSWKGVKPQQHGQSAHVESVRSGARHAAEAAEAAEAAATQWARLKVCGQQHIGQQMLPSWMSATPGSICCPMCSSPRTLRVAPTCTSAAVAGHQRVASPTGYLKCGSSARVAWWA